MTGRDGRQVRPHVMGHVRGSSSIVRTGRRNVGRLRSGLRAMSFARLPVLLFFEIDHLTPSRRHSTRTASQLDFGSLPVIYWVISICDRPACPPTRAVKRAGGFSYNTLSADHTQSHTHTHTHNLESETTNRSQYRPNLIARQDGVGGRRVTDKPSPMRQPGQMQKQDL